MSQLLSFLTVILVFSTLPLSISMAQPTENPSTRCKNCGRNVEFVAVKSDANGNKGRLLAKVSQYMRDY